MASHNSVFLGLRRYSWWDDSALKWLLSPRHADCVQLGTSGRGKRNELARAGVFSDSG